MTFYEKVADGIHLEKFYRFQGYLSYNYYDVNKALTNEIQKPATKYIYLSKNLKHHQYYLTKRIIQLINREILKKSNLELNPRTAQSLNTYREVLINIKKYQEALSIYSIELDFCPIFLELLNGNVVRNIKQKSVRKIELVDHKRNGGGYGFCDDWLRLLDYLTLFYRFKNITLEDIISIVKRYHLAILYEEYNNNKLFPEKFWKRNIKLQMNPNIFNDFAKYDIVETMERLFDSSLVEPNSPLGRNPHNMIKRTIEEFEIKRRLAKTKLESYYNNNY